jgi:hypothetical protein
MRAWLLGAAVATSWFPTTGCDPGCRSVTDCDTGELCTFDGTCEPDPEGSVRFVEPAAGSTVGETFDAVLELRFRGDTAQLEVDRAGLDESDPCAPFVPRHLVVDGDPTEILTQRITLRGLRALGEEFTLGARMLASGERKNDVLELHGPALDVGGVSIVSPRVTGDDPTLDASLHVAVPVSAAFDGAAARASMFVEVFNDDGVRVESTPSQLVAAGTTAFTDALAPLSRAPQIIWIRLDDDNAATRTCGLGVAPPAVDADVDRSLELGLSWDAPEPAQLQLRAQAGADGPVCAFQGGEGACTPVVQSRGPAAHGEEILRLDAADGVVTVVVAPSAASGPVLARVRVSMNGRHVGWLGPMAVNPGQGEAWLAGRIVVTGAVAHIQPSNDVVIGAPF